MKLYLGLLQDLGGDDRYVISHDANEAKAALLAAWREYDRKYHSDYHGRVKTFKDLSEIYGANVFEMKPDQVTTYGQMEPV